MDYLLALLAMVLGFLLYRAWQILRSGRRGSRSRIAPAVRGRRAQEDSRPRRPLQWISMSDFPRVLAENGDLVVIDLRGESQRVPLPVSSVEVLTVRTHELEEVLNWLPENRSAVFLGASGLCVFMIESSPSMHGSAPFYLLEADRGRAEVA